MVDGITLSLALRVKFIRKRQLALSEHLSNNDSITQHRQGYTSTFYPELYIGLIMWLYFKDF